MQRKRLFFGSKTTFEFVFFLDEDTEGDQSGVITCEKCGRQFDNYTMKLRHDEYFHAESTPIKSAPKYPSTNSGNRNNDDVNGDHSSQNSTDLRKRLSPTVEKLSPETNINPGMQCQQCTKWFPSAEKLKAHLNSDCPNRIANRNTSSQIARRVSESTRLAKISSTSLICDYCDSEFKLDRTKERHMQKFHAEKLALPKTINKVFSCEKCHRMYSDEASLNRHLEAIHTESVIPKSPIKQKEKIPSKQHSQPANKKRRTSEKLEPLKLGSKPNSTKPTEYQNGNTDSPTENDDVSIYCDEDNMQCLICLAKLPSLEELKSHIESEHSTNSCVDEPSPITEPENVEGAQYLSDFPTNDWTSELIDKNGEADTDIENLECGICGKKCKTKSDFETHISIPHKIAIRETVG